MYTTVTEIHVKDKTHSLGVPINFAPLFQTLDVFHEVAVASLTYYFTSPHLTLCETGESDVSHCREMTSHFPLCCLQMHMGLYNAAPTSEFRLSSLLLLSTSQI